MITLILCVVLFSFLSSIFISKKIGVVGVEYFCLLSLTLALGLSLINFIQVVILGISSETSSWLWFLTQITTIEFNTLNDNLCSIMFFVVLSISTLVHYYSKFYMEGDPHLPRFLSYLSLFTFLMLILVSSSNLIQLFIGWEGVGICSYLLVSYWYTRNSAIKSALKAIIVNRFGDIGFILGVLMIWVSIESFNFEIINSFLSSNQNICGLTSICFIIAAAGKSAQFGLHSWLPDAMEGPTPVSALIHAATMVTAGIFLIIRVSSIFNFKYLTSSFVLILGSLTAIFAASIGLVQNDFKKVIAYSTCSQLGYMALICGISEYSLSLFHLFNHAFFKALLFLSAGSLIHSLSDEQDFRKSGNLVWSSPLTLLCVIIGSLSLMGLPFLTGFYSKDTILELSNCYSLFSSAYWLGLTAASFTAFYSFRLLLIGLLKEDKGSRLVKFLSIENNLSLTINLIVLSGFSIIIGYFSIQFFKLDSIPIINSFSKHLPLIFTLFGSGLTFFLCSSQKFINILNPLWIKSLIHFLRSAWAFDIIFHSLVSKNFINLGEFFYHKIDRQSIEQLGPWRINESLTKLTTKLNFYQTGWLYNYPIFLLSFLLIYLLI